MPKLQFDIVFVDTTTPRYYETRTLDIQGIGGTEASVIRIAEALGAFGAKVAVLQHNLPMVLPGEYCNYLPLSMIDDIETRHYVMLRGCQFVEKFPRAKKYSWHQDVPNQLLASMRDTFLEHDVTVIGASDWHKGELQRWLCDSEKKINPKVVRIYNPVPDNIYVPKNTEVKYNPNKLVWVASPHKGLKEALEYMRSVIAFMGNKDIRLHVFNPGYFAAEGITQPDFVINRGSVPCQELWQHMSESLCVFYPTKFEETFGCIAAEANAVHCPVLTNRVAALNETVSSDRQFIAKNDLKNLVDTVVKWHSGDRPKVWGQDRFRLTSVLEDWISLLSTGNVR